MTHYSHSLRRPAHAVALAIATLGMAASAHATIVTSFDAGYTAAGQWFESDVRPGGTVSTVNLVGAGGNLETSRPAGNGAVLLTTSPTDNNAKAEVSVADAYGQAGNILRSLTLDYDYYRSNSPSTNQATAPSLKLTFQNTNGCIGDCYVTLIYEAYLQTPALTNPVSGEWTHVDIDFSNGLFWQNGGFGQSNSAGGPPLNTLANWLNVFSADFAAAQLISVGMGVGSFNLGQIDYFDKVEIAHSFGNGYLAAYDFEAAAAEVPEPMSLALVAAALFGAGAVSRRRKSR